MLLNLQGLHDSQKYTAVVPHSQPTMDSSEEYLKDTYGNSCHLPRDINIGAHVASLVDGYTTDTTLESYRQSISTLSYKPTQRGRFHLITSVNGVVTISYLSLYVQHPPVQLGHRVRIIEGFNDPRRVVNTRNEHIVVTERGSKLIRRIGPLEDGHQRMCIKPTGVAIGNDGTLFVADYCLKMSCEGKLLKTVGGRGTDSVQVVYQCGIKLISNLKLFVCDGGNHRVEVFDTDLKCLDYFGTERSGEGEFDWPYDITTDRNGSLYVADCFNHRVRMFSQSGSFLRSFGQCGIDPGELYQPVGIHIHNKHVYITDLGSPCVSVFTTSGEFAFSFAVGHSVKVRDISTDRIGYLYVCNPDSDCIYIY